MRENHSTDRARAEALFKKEKQMRKGAKAMAEYEVAQQVTREKTTRLRALRLARDAAKQSRSENIDPFQRSINRFSAR